MTKKLVDTLSIPGLSVEAFTIDLPDALTTKILSERWLQTAGLLGLAYNHAAVAYGEGKFQYRAVVEGETEDVARLVKLVDESLDLIDRPKDH